MFSCWQLYDGNWVGGNFVFIKEVRHFVIGGQTIGKSILGAATGRGGQGVEVGDGDLEEEQGGVPCAWATPLSSWTRNQVNQSMLI